MDPEALLELSRRFWYRLGAALAVGAVAVVLVVAVVQPGESPVILGLTWLCAVLYVGFAAVEWAVGSGVGAAGNAVAAVGWVALGLSASEFLLTDQLLYPSLGVLLVGGVLGMAADRLG